MMMMGHSVTVHLVNGYKYVGILDVRDPITGSTALKYARQITDQVSQTQPQIFPHLNILGKDIVYVKATGMRHSKINKMQQADSRRLFKTDVGISSGNGSTLKERPLQKWTDPDAPPVLLEGFIYIF